MLSRCSAEDMDFYRQGGCRSPKPSVDHQRTQLAQQLDLQCPDFEADRDAWTIQIKTPK